MADTDLPRSKCCAKCGIAKPRDAFNRQRDAPMGLRSRCRSCQHEDYIRQREQYSERGARYRRENSDRERARHAKYQKENPDKVRELASRYRERNRDVVRQRQREHDRRHRSTLRGRLDNTISSGVHRALKAGTKAGRSWEAILGYTVDQLMAHLEKQFQPGMSWDNYGKAWHVDHKIPLAAHNYETPENIDFQRAWALTNLQPLWAFDNISKKDRLDRPFQPSLAL